MCLQLPISAPSEHRLAALGNVGAFGGLVSPPPCNCETRIPLGPHDHYLDVVNAVEEAAKLFVRFVFAYIVLCLIGGAVEEDEPLARQYFPRLPVCKCRDLSRSPQLLPAP